MAAVLYQEIDQQRHVIVYASSRSNPRQQKYHNTEHECLALVWGIRKYQSYLEDRPGETTIKLNIRRYCQ
jgi:hypothetical protein